MQTPLWDAGDRRRESTSGDWGLEYHDEEWGRARRDSFVCEPTCRHASLQRIPSLEVRRFGTVLPQPPFRRAFFFPFILAAGSAGTEISNEPPAASASTPSPFSIFVFASKKNITSLT